jgi:hypothetical protein
VLGETYVGRWPNGVMIFAEQISHHPPISCIQIRCPANDWRIDAHLRAEIGQGLMKADIMQKGFITLRLNDGAIYQWEYPTIRAVGIVKGDRIVKIKGPLKVNDIQNGLEAYVKVAPKVSKTRGIVHPRATTIWGGVRRAGAPKDSFLTTITGDYAGTICVDGEPVWNIEADFAQRPCAKVDEEDLLLSDCRFRVDRGTLIQGDMEAADAAKKLVETLQRQDAKMRVSVAPRKSDVE